MALQSGTIKGQTNTTNWGFEFDWSENSTSTSSNTSSVTVVAYITRPNSASYIQGNVNITVTYSCTGCYNQTSSLPYLDYTSVPKGGRLQIGSTTFSVPHDADGNKYIDLGAWFTNDASPRSGDASGGVQLTKINRYPAFTTNPSITERTETTAKFKWGAVDITSDIYWSLDNSSWQHITTDVTSITGLTAKSNYTLYVQARNRADDNLRTTKSVGFSTYDYPYPTSSPDFTIGDKLTISMENPLNRGVAMTFVFPDKSEYYDKYTYSGSSISGYDGELWQKKLFASLKNASSGKYKVKIAYSGVTKTSSEGTVSVPSGAKPVINGNVKDVNSITLGLTNNANTIIKGYSTARVTPTITASSNAYDTEATITAKTCEGKTFTSNYYDIAKATKSTFTVTATNSHGSSFTTTTQLSVSEGFHPYFTPTIVNCLFDRPYQTGTRMSLAFNGNFYNSFFDTKNNRNSNRLRLFIYVKKKEDDDWVFVQSVKAHNTQSEESMILDEDYTLGENSYSSSYSLELYNPLIEAHLNAGEWSYLSTYQFKLVVKDVLCDDESVIFTQKVTIGQTYFEWWRKNDTNYFNVNGKLLQNNAPVLQMKTVKSIGISHGQTYQDDMIKKALNITFYYTMNDNKYRHSETIHYGDTEWHFDVYSTYTMYIKVDWDNGIILTSQYDAGSKLLGYDLIYTEGGD